MSVSQPIAEISEEAKETFRARFALVKEYLRPSLLDPLCELVVAYAASSTLGLRQLNSASVRTDHSYISTPRIGPMISLANKVVFRVDTLVGVWDGVHAVEYYGYYTTPEILGFGTDLVKISDSCFVTGGTCLVIWEECDVGFRRTRIVFDKQSPMAHVKDTMDLTGDSCLPAWSGNLVPRQSSKVSIAVDCVTKLSEDRLILTFAGEKIVVLFGLSCRKVLKKWQLSDLIWEKSIEAKMGSANSIILSVYTRSGEIIRYTLDQDHASTVTKYDKIESVRPAHPSLVGELIMEDETISLGLIDSPHLNKRQNGTLLGVRSHEIGLLKQSFTIPTSYKNIWLAQLNGKLVVLNRADACVALFG